MPKSLMKSMIDALLPKGSIWIPKVNGFFEKVLFGLADSFDVVRLKLTGLAYIRNAKLTPVLDDLEKDYGLPFNSNLTKSERRAALDSRINAVDNTGSRQELGAALQRAGFPVFVYSNSPAIDPSRLQDEYITIAGGEAAFAGEPSAVAGAFLAELVVNGNILVVTDVFLLVSGGTTAFAGEPEAIAEIESVIEADYLYTIPSNPDLWPFIFFVGGDADFAVDGSIIRIGSVDIDINRREEFLEIILKYKPVFTWGLLKINFI